MFGQHRNREPDAHREPLLGGEEEDTVFAITDDDDDEEDSALTPKQPHTVRFQDTVQVIAPPLRSTYASREAGGLDINQRA